MQVERGRHGASTPTVHGVGLGGGVGVAAHSPSHGSPAVELCVGVQVDPMVQGALFPTVQPVGGRGVGLAIHCPFQGCPGVEI